MREENQSALAEIREAVQDLSFNTGQRFAAIEAKLDCSSCSVGRTSKEDGQTWDHMPMMASTERSSLAHKAALTKRGCSEIGHESSLSRSGIAEQAAGRPLKPNTLPGVRNNG